MQIHHHVPHGLHFSIDPKELLRMELGATGGGDASEWDELESQYDDEILATNVIAFLHEADTE